MIIFNSCDIYKYRLKKYFPSFLMGFYIKSFSRTQLEQEERQSRSKQVLLSQYPDSSILGLNVGTSYVRNSYEFAVSKQVGMPGNFQHVMTSVTLYIKKKKLH